MASNRKADTQLKCLTHTNTKRKSIYKEHAGTLATEICSRVANYTHALDTECVSSEFLGTPPSRNDYSLLTGASHLFLLHVCYT